MEKLTIYIEQLLSGWGVASGYTANLALLVLVTLAILLAFAVGFLLSRFVPLAERLTTKTKTKWDDLLLGRDVLKSACHIVPAIIIWMFLPAIFYRYPTIEEVLARVTAVYITIMSLSTLLTIINSLKKKENDTRDKKLQYMHSLVGILKVISIFISVIIIIAIVIGKSPMALLAGLGATSAILMLIFQDTIKGFVAGIRITSNGMLHKGDWITVPKAGIDGVVEEISLTTVKVRNWDRTILTITPQTLVDDSFQNWLGMQESDGRRVKRKVYYDFNTIRPLDDAMCKRLVKKGYFKSGEIKKGMVNMTVYRRYMERLLRETAAVNSDMVIMVRQLEATNTGLPVEFYFFLSDKTWVNYEHNLADIMDMIYALTPEFDLKIYQLQISNEG